MGDEHMVTAHGAAWQIDGLYRAKSKMCIIKAALYGDDGSAGRRLARSVACGDV